MLLNFYPLPMALILLDCGHVNCQQNVNPDLHRSWRALSRPGAEWPGASLTGAAGLVALRVGWLWCLATLVGSLGGQSGTGFA